MSGPFYRLPAFDPQVFAKLPKPDGESHIHMQLLDLQIQFIGRHADKVQLSFEGKSILVMRNALLEVIDYTGKRY